MPGRPMLAVGGLVLLGAIMVGIAQLTGRDGAELHPLGTEVRVGYYDVRSDGSAGARTTIGLTVLGVRTGTQADLEANGIEVDPEDRSATPYYVDARYANRGAEAVERRLSVGLEDSEGNTFGELIVFGARAEPFAPCPESGGGKLEPGESYEDCTLVLVPDGLEVERVYYLSQSGPAEEPELVYWAPE